jgi:hypothetical protein
MSRASDVAITSVRGTLSDAPFSADPSDVHEDLEA